MSKHSTLHLSLILIVLWALNWPASQVALDVMPPVTFRMITLLGGACALFAFSAKANEPMAVPIKVWPKLVALALLNVGIFNVLSAYSINVLEGGRAAIMAFTMPVWVTIIETVLGSKITLSRGLSLLAGILGLSLIAISVVSDKSFEPVAALLMCLAALCWAWGSVWLARAPIPLGAKPAAMWMIIISAIFVVFLFPVQNEPMGSLPATASGWLGLIFAAVIGMGFCQSLWFTLLEKVGAVHGAFILLAIPPVGVFMSWSMTHAPVTWLDIAGLIFLLAAALTSALSNKPEP
jgi:drug/metabolite transporter (DMT)-like permease